METKTKSLSMTGKVPNWAGEVKKSYWDDKILLRGKKSLQIQTAESFDGIVDTYKKEKRSFRLVHKPYQTNLISGEPYKFARFKDTYLIGSCKIRGSVYGDLTPKMLQCLKEVNMDFVKRIFEKLKNGNLEKLKPTHDWPISFVFRENWNKISIGSFLWYIDFDHFYATIAVKLGFLSPEIFQKYIYDEFKVVKNMAMSKTVSKVKVDYYIDGKLSHSIQTDTSGIENGYHNVIQFARNFINYICDKYSWVVLGRDIDNIIFPYTSKTLIIGKYMEAHGFDYKKYLAKKISNNELEIMFDHRIKRYSNFI